MKGWIALVFAAALPMAGFSQGTSPADEPAPGAVDLRLRNEKAAPGRIITAHRPTYILPLTYSFDPNNEPFQSLDDGGYELDEVEIKFQISLKAEVWSDIFGDNGDLYFAYTQQSLWQAYDFENSSPFRDTNYEPEMFVTFDTDIPVLGLKNRLITAGIVHQSNGRGSEELSRSWNRVFASFLLERGNFALLIKPWYRLSEDEEDDNNPDIEDYLGYGDLKMAYKWHDLGFAAILRNNLDFDENRGSAQLDFTFPLVKEIRGYIQYFNGYGECLLDYDHRDERIGIGFMIGDWLQ